MTQVTSKVFLATKFGAVADGSIGQPNSGHNNAVAINEAIQTACANGGGTISLPAGTLNIAIEPSVPRQTSGVAAITIPCSNIVLQGAGRDSTTLSFWLIENGRDVVPTSICPRNADAVSTVVPRAWRGSGIYIVGGRTANSATTNVTVRDLRITGNASINGNNKNPVTWDGSEPLASNSVCNAWDTSNKGIYLQNNDFSQGSKGIDRWGFYPPIPSYFDAVQIINVHVDHFLGELLYEGNTTLADSIVRSSEFDHSNGDCISVGGGWQFIGNFCHDVSANAFENTPGAGPQIYSGNHIQDVSLDGIGITNLEYSGLPNREHGGIEITNNVLQRAKRRAISLFDADHVVISGNSITDSQIGISMYDFGSTQPAPPIPPAGPPAPTIVPQRQGAGAVVPAGTIFASVAWHYGDQGPRFMPSASSVSADSTLTVDGSTQVVVKSPQLTANGTQPAPTGWEVFIGRDRANEHLQGGVLPLGRDFVLAGEPSTTGMLRSHLAGTPTAPQSAPLVVEQAGGSIGAGTYDLAAAWLAEGIEGRVISPPGPRATVQLRGPNSQIVVSLPADPPENATGYLVFEGQHGGALYLATELNAPIAPNASAAITKLADPNGLALPGPRGTMLSPNVHDVQIDHNTFISDGINSSVGIQCCGTPKVWPMLKNVNVADNEFVKTAKAKTAGFGIKKPLDIPAEIANPSTNFARGIQKPQIVEGVVLERNVVR